ncbi:MAG: SET domain-containing protein-lysine N-methyltransferase [Chlamydiota bacterium]
MKPRSDTSQDDTFLFTQFEGMGLTYSTELRFQKESQKALFVAVWKQNRDPTKTFLATYFREELLSGRHPNVVLARDERSRGYKVLLQERFFPRGGLVGEYTGVVKKGSIATFFSPYTVVYPTPFSSFRGFVIDAKHEGNFTRFINHAKKPTVEMKSVLCPDGLIHMVFVAKRPLRKGEEITLNYGTAIAAIRWGL